MFDHAPCADRVGVPSAHGPMQSPRDEDTTTPDESDDDLDEDALQPVAGGNLQPGQRPASPTPAGDKSL